MTHAGGSIFGQRPRLISEAPLTLLQSYRSQPLRLI